MKTSILSRIQIFVLSIVATLITEVLYGQNSGGSAPDLKVDVNVNKHGPSLGGGDWMSNPLVWVIGALVLILIIALVARGGGNKN